MFHILAGLLIADKKNPKFRSLDKFKSLICSRWGQSLPQLDFLYCDFFPGWFAHIFLGASCILGSRMCIHVVCSCHLLAHRTYATGCFSFAPCRYVPIVRYNGIQAGNTFFPLYHIMDFSDKNLQRENHIMLKPDRLIHGFAECQSQQICLKTSLHDLSSGLAYISLIFFPRLWFNASMRVNGKMLDRYKMSLMLQKQSDTLKIPCTKCWAYIFMSKRGLHRGSYSNATFKFVLVSVR